MLSQLITRSTTRGTLRGERAAGVSVGVFTVSAVLQVVPHSLVGEAGGAGVDEARWRASAPSFSWMMPRSRTRACPAPWLVSASCMAVALALHVAREVHGRGRVMHPARGHSSDCDDALSSHHPPLRAARCATRCATASDGVTKSCRQCRRAAGAKRVSLPWRMRLRSARHRRSEHKPQRTETIILLHQLCGVSKICVVTSITYVRAAHSYR